MKVSLPTAGGWKEMNFQALPTQIIQGYYNTGDPARDYIIYIKFLYLLP